MEMADKADAFSVFQLIETFREIHPEMPMQMAAVFILIAMKPGISQAELLRFVDISQPGMSRNVVALTTVNRHGAPGLGLVEQQPAPHDARITVLQLTAKGKSFLEKLLAIWRKE
jgi:DNA-binding MarR family transcriptional regulator